MCIIIHNIYNICMNDITCVFGAQVRRYRLEKGMSQDQLACATGIERSQISKIESGLVDLQLTTAKKLADTLEVEMSDLLKKSSFETHPFVKWAGGKTQLLSNLISYMPTTYGDYYEPFIGGGALLFKLQPEHPHINDANNELLSVYRCFLDKSKCQKLMELLLRYQQNHSEEQYYEVRALDKSEEWNNSATDVERAARMIYLNKSCFNGLYRVNSKGFFNVPSGKKKTVNCFDKDNFEGILILGKHSLLSLTETLPSVSKTLRLEILFILIRHTIHGMKRTVSLPMTKAVLAKKTRQDLLNVLGNWMREA